VKPHSDLNKESDMEYSEQLIQQVWEKGRASGDINSDLWREDECGAWICRADYGKTDTDFGWKIVNVTAGAPDTPENLRPFHHRNGYDLANRQARSHVTADRTGLATFEHAFDLRNRNI
jgi:hypothetical protein